MSRRFEIRVAGVRLKKLSKALRFYVPRLSGSWRYLLGAVGCAVGAVGAQLLRPWPIKWIFDGLLIPRVSGQAGTLPVALQHVPGDMLLLGICLSLLAIALLWGLFSYGQAYLTARAGHSVVYALRYQAHAHLQRLSLSFHQRQKRGDLLMRLTGDINVLRDMLVDAAILGVSSLLLLGTMLGILLTMDWRLALVIVALLPFLAATSFSFSTRIRRAAQRQRKTEGHIAAVINETLHGIPVIQSFGRARARDKQFERGNRRGLRAGLRTMRLEASMTRVVEILLAAGTALVFFYGVRRVQGGVLTPGDLLVFVSYVHSSFKPMRKLARVASRFAKAIVCAERVKEVLRTAPEVRDLPGAKRIKKTLSGTLELRRVSFRYPGSGDALHRASFDIEPGTTLGVVGPSGAGKSTILSLLTRLYDPTRGRVRVDGKDIRRYTVESLRSQMSVVLQEPFLFGDTIRDNLLFAKPEATELELQRALQLADATGFVSELPGGLDARVAEAGSSLSCGQRQRLAIARAFLRQAPILLLDEPTTGLDAAAEAKVMIALSRLMRNSTTVMVAHKLATVQNADDILVVKRGRIAERGTHDELIALDGWYSRHWQQQADEYPTSKVLPFDGRSVAGGRG